LVDLQYGELKIRNKISNIIVQKPEQKQNAGQKGGGKGKPPPRHLWVARHGPKCTCPDCRIYYTVEDGEVKKKSGSIIPEDRNRTLDTYEYITGKKANKLKDAEKLSDIEK
jgi:hypothetical protein